ncbi:3464_t:CDS:2, partial [Cetraspora pellucida]
TNLELRAGVACCKYELRLFYSTTRAAIIVAIGLRLCSKQLYCESLGKPLVAE